MDVRNLIARRWLIMFRPLPLVVLSTLLAAAPTYADDVCVDVNGDGLTTDADAFAALRQAVGASACGGVLRIVHMPDTQYYASTYPPQFGQQTRWIADQRPDYVVHSGDIVNDASSLQQWKIADAAMALLDDAGIAYGVVPGNHDQFPNSDRSEGSTSNYRSYFGTKRFVGLPHYASFTKQNDSHFDLVGNALIFIYVEWGDIAGGRTVEWVQAALASHPERVAVIVTHYALNLDGSLSEDGEQIMRELAGFPNLKFVISGHVHGEATAVHRRHGNDVTFLVANYQARTNGGDGWLRIYDFDIGTKRLTATTYSPILDAYEHDADSEFVMDW